MLSRFLVNQCFFKAAICRLEHIPISRVLIDNCVFTMAGLSTQEFCSCTQSPLEIVKADPQIKADPGSRVFCFLSCHNSSGKISNQVPG